MHVVFITPGYAKDERDSTNIPPLQALARKLTENGVHVTVLAIDFPLNAGRYKIGKIEVVSCGGKNLGWPLKALTLLKAAREFSIINKKKRVDVINSFWWQDTALLGSLIGKRYNIPHLTTCLGQDVLGTNKYAQWFSAKGEYVVTLSAFHAQKFKQTFGRECNEIIPLGIEPSEFTAAEIWDKDIDIIGVGSLSDVKNYDEFIDVVALVKQRMPGIKCVLVGDGKNRQKLEQKVNAMGLTDNLSFTGLLPRADVLGLMAQSRVFLHTSRFEGIGYIFLEALMSRARIVSHEVGMANSSNALIGTSATELAQHVISVLGNEDSFVAPPLYTAQQTAESYIRLYQKLLNS